MADDLGIYSNSFNKFKLPLFLGVGGMFLLLVGWRIYQEKQGVKVEFIEASPQAALVFADISGAVESPGVYELASGSRIHDLLVKAGGLSSQADRVWVDKNLNLAAKIIDGGKIYIPEVGEDNIFGITTDNTVSNISKDILNINTASKAELEALPGIGSVTAQKILENRLYQNVEELLTKKIVNKSTFEKIKAKIIAY